MDGANVEDGRPVKRPICQAGWGVIMAQTKVVTVETWKSGRLEVLLRVKLTGLGKEVSRCGC